MFRPMTFPGQGMGQGPSSFGQNPGMGQPQTPDMGQGAPNMGTGPTPNAQAYAHANPNAAFMRPQFPGQGGMIGGGPDNPAAGAGQQGLLGQPTASMPDPWQNIMQQRWNTIGGGQPFPQYMGGYRSALQNYRQANPGFNWGSTS